MKKISYSVVIPTYNRSHFLLKTLESVSSQTIPKDNYEIIVIDDGSTDDTRKVVEKFNENNPESKVRYLHQKNSGCAKARNNGILNSKGQIIFFTDDDCVVPNNWMEKILDAFQRYPETVGVGGWYEPTDEVFKENKYDQFFRFFASQAYPGMENCEIYTNTTNSPAGNTANMAYKKSALMEAGLFDERINFTGFVDWELKIRMIFDMKFPLLYVPLNTTHKKKMTFKEFFCKSFRNGRGRDYCQKKYSPLKESSYHNQSIWKLITDVQLWIDDYEKNKFWKIYLAHLFAGLLGRYANRILKFKPAYHFVQWRPVEKIFYHMLLPNGKIIKEESMPYDHKNMCSNFGDGPISDEEELYFSIVVATFNRKNLILETLNSLINQTITGDNYEIIIVDDGSTDGSEFYVKQFINSHPEYEIKYIRQKNAGPAVARNRGAKEARGKILAFTDDDCAVPKDWLERLVRIYEMYPEVSGVGGWLATPKSNSSSFDKYQWTKNPAINNQENNRLFFTNSLTKNFVFNTANLSLKKEAFFEAGGINELFKTPGWEDFDLGLKILEKGFTVAYMPYSVIHLKSLNRAGCISLARNRFNNYMVFLREKNRIPANYIQNHTISKLIIKFIDALKKPSQNKFIELIEYTTRLQTMIQDDINIKDFYRKSYKLDPSLEKNLAQEDRSIFK